ncbi:MAG: Na+-dependent transporter [Verrucomicrobia bacterium]|nr:Na+-dependent transporter [Verrucomicrobiota bacterium]
MPNTHDHEGLGARFSHYLHRYFLGLLIGSYVLAGFFPGLGKMIRHISLGQISGFGETTSFSMSMLMLGLLLFHAALSIETVRDLIRTPRFLVAGLAANLFLPVLVLFFASYAMSFWSTPEHLQAVIVALALLSAVPIAGSATAYTQNTDGDVPLSIGLVLFSTFLSPWLMPISLHLTNYFSFGDYTPALVRLKTGAPTLVLFLSVLLPSVLGLGVRPLLGIQRIQSFKPTLKLLNSTCLLLLNYTTASIALPQVFVSPDWGFLSTALIFGALLCAIDFLSGWWLARILQAKTAQCLALMFGVGMNNNGTALVLASLAFVHAPKILVPMIFYNLLQNIIASGAVTFVSARSDS